jgi:hypothetical protein
MYVADEAERMLRRFLHRPVVVDTSLGPIVGVLLAADCSSHRGLGTLILGVAGGPQVLIRAWTVIKLTRSHT